MNNDSLAPPSFGEVALHATTNALLVLVLMTAGIALCFATVYVAQLRRAPAYRTLSGGFVLAWVAMPVFALAAYLAVAHGTGQSLMPEIPAGVGPMLGKIAPFFLGAVLLAAATVATVWAIRVRARLHRRAARAKKIYAEAMRLYLGFETVQAYEHPELVTTNNPKVKTYLAKMGPAHEASVLLEESRILTAGRVEQAHATAHALLRALKEAGAGVEPAAAPARTASEGRGMINP